MMDQNRIIRDAVFEVLGILGTISPSKLEVNPNTREEAAKIMQAKSILRRSVESGPIVTTTDRVPPIQPSEHNIERFSVENFGNIFIGYKRISVDDILQSLRNQIEDMTYGGITENAEMLAMAGILIERAYTEKDGGQDDGQKKETGTTACHDGKPEKRKPTCSKRCK